MKFFAILHQGQTTGADNSADGVVSEDVNGRLQAEERLRRSDEHFDQFVAEVRDYAIFLLDPEGHVTTWNLGANHIKGYEGDEIIGQHFSVFYPQEAIERGWPDYELEVARAEGRFEDEGWRVRKDKSLFWANVVITAVSDEQGRLRGFSKITRDLSERKRAEEKLRQSYSLLEKRVEERTAELTCANEGLQSEIEDRKRTEQALRESEERYRRLITAMPTAVYTTDREGRITLFNDHAVELWGRRPAIGESWCGSFRIFRPDGTPLPLDECPMAITLREGRPVRGQEIIIERPDGRRVCVLPHPEPLRNASGEIEGAVNMLVDITDRKRMEDALQEADRRKDEFLAMLAHELRNPLAPISNSLQLLRLADDLGPTVEHVRDIMESQVSQLVRLVDDLLDVSRIAGGKIELRKESVDLAAVIARAVETSRPLIEAANHQLAITIPPQPLTLEADAVRLTQVITNLLNNAAKYTEPGGQIWLTVRRDGREAVVSVRDTGLGIPAEMLPRVFDMFAQVAGTLNRAQGGLGIGLTLAKTFVQMHGGRIKVHSAGVGKGSEFTVHLPLASRVPSSTALTLVSGGATKALPTRRIVVVDDTRSAAYTLAKLLEKIGQLVSTKCDAASAINHLRTEPADVIISDIGMPDIDGYELARRLRQEPGLKGLVLVALTGYGRDSDRQRAMDAGFDYHLVKPVSLEALEGLLASLPATGEGQSVGLTAGRDPDRIQRPATESVAE